MIENLIILIRDFISGFTDTYLILLNTAGFILMGCDKIMAKMAKRRIPEKFLFFAALSGGSLGTWIGMHFFKHKTRHAQFKYGIPLIFILQSGGALLYVFWF